MLNRIFRFCISLSTVVAIFFATTGGFVYAAVGINTQIQYQGILKNTAGEFVSDGSYDIVFKLYTASSGGVAIWTGTHTSGNGNAVTVTDGLVSVMLGSGTGNSLDSVDFNQDALYLGVTVGTDSEMTPRIRLGAAAYAFNARAVNGLQFADTSYSTGDIFYVNSDGDMKKLAAGSGGQVLSVSGGLPAWVATSSISQWSTNRSNISYTSGNVGIGTTSPYARLSVVGEVVGARFTATTSTASVFPYASTTALSVSGTGYFGTASTTNLTISGISGCSGSNALTTDAAGVVACGAISGGSAFPFTPATNFGVNTSATTTPIWAQNGLYASSTSQFAAANFYGSVGVGTTSPWAQLSVNPNGITGPAVSVGSSTKTLFTIAQNGAGVSINKSGVASIAELEVFGNSAFGTVLLARNDSNVGNGEQLGMIGFDGLDSLSTGGTSYSADIRAFATESHTNAAKGTYMSFNIKPNGASQSGGSVEVMRLSELTNVGIGTTTPFVKFQVATSSAHSQFRGQLVLTDTSAVANGKHWYLSSQASSFYIGTTSDAYATTTYLTILNGGNVGIGTTTPSTLLNVFGSSATPLTLERNTTDSNVGIEFKDQTASWYAGKDSTGNFSINGSANLAGSPELTLTTAGALTVASCTGCSSDARLKTDVETLPATALDKLKQLRPVSFHWAGPVFGVDLGSSTQFGFIAQEAQEIFPELVYQDVETPLTPGSTFLFNYQGLISPMVAAIQELDEKIESLNMQGGIAQVVSGGASFVADQFAEWLGDVTNGLTRIFSKEVHTDTLCVGDICITEDELEEILHETQIRPHQNPLYENGGGGGNGNDESVVESPAVIEEVEVRDEKEDSAETSREDNREQESVADTAPSEVGE